MNFTLHTLSRNYLEENIEHFIPLLYKNLQQEYWTSTHFLTDLPGKWTLSQYVLNDQNNIIGFLIASEKQSTIHIHKFLVDASAQSQGVGSSMLEELFRVTRKNVTLKVRTDNIQAISFYKKHGFGISDQVDALYTMTLLRNG